MSHDKKPSVLKAIARVLGGLVALIVILVVAGHDDALKDRYPKEGVPVLTFHRSAEHPSRVELPLKRLN